MCVCHSLTWFLKWQCVSSQRNIFQYTQILKNIRTHTKNAASHTLRSINKLVCVERARIVCGSAAREMKMSLIIIFGMMRFCWFFFLNKCWANLKLINCSIRNKARFVVILKNKKHTAKPHQQRHTTVAVLLRWFFFSIFLETRSLVQIFMNICVCVE